MVNSDLFGLDYPYGLVDFVQDSWLHVFRKRLSWRELAKRSTCFLFVGTVVFASCVPGCKTNEGLVTPNPPVITDQNECQAACENLQRHNCDEGKPIEMGKQCSETKPCLNVKGEVDMFQACLAGQCVTSCTNFCIDTENQGVWLDPNCVKQITSCEQINSCPLPQKPKPTCYGPACPPDIRTDK